jgi:D-sedoheptulose 7-phosphate isomerase
MSEISDKFARTFYSAVNQDEEGAGLRESLIDKARESADIKVRFFEANAETILRVSQDIARAFHRGGKLLVCGNGGSCTDAQHIAVEFMHPITVGRKALPAVCLSNDTAMTTAVANDVGFAEVFSRQIIALGREGDVLLAVSTSGNSQNLVSAVRTARRMKLLTVALSGSDGGELAEMAKRHELDYCLNVSTLSIHRIQETHVALYHILWDLVHSYLHREDAP